MCIELVGGISGVCGSNSLPMSHVPFTSIIGCLGPLSAAVPYQHSVHVHLYILIKFMSNLLECYDDCFMYLHVLYEWSYV